MKDYFKFLTAIFKEVLLTRIILLIFHGKTEEPKSVTIVKKEDTYAFRIGPTEYGKR